MNKAYMIHVCLVLLLVLTTSDQSYGHSKSEPESRSQTSAAYNLRTYAICSTGSHSAGDHFKTSSTIGQSTPIGICSTDGMLLSAGFWRVFEGIRSPIKPVIPDVPYNALYQNYPNPFNPITTIRYSVAIESPVSLVVYNVQGRKVRTLVNERKPGGIYNVIWNGSNERGQHVASGVYFYKLTIGSHRFVKKMLLLK